ncbi:MAG TPA: VWA domain-containing protein [Nevskiaceae bacterium]|nr:VWA domain-containing protein [Nevskiaceae bacterium]
MTPRAVGFMLFLAAGLSPAMATAPEIARTVLVLDASGSMWGVIQGRSKMAIAREAVGRLLAGWPSGPALGLMAYGHRRKGDCGDIELLEAPTGFDAEALRQQVQALQPKGMTPISAAVRRAAEALRYTEQAATVILISDGEETCEADPCALGAELERLGVGFTAHVIGFDLPEGPARRQLQCLAQVTGGQYREAGDAEGLNQALATVASAAPTLNTAQAWIPGHSLVWQAGSQVESEGPDGTRVVAFTPEQTAQACQALCQDDARCGGWHYEPTGSYFIDHPRCHLKGLGAPLQLEAQDPDWVAGVKPGVRLIVNPEAE